MSELSALQARIEHLEQLLVYKERAEQLQEAILKISELGRQEITLCELYETLHGIITELINTKNFFIALLDEQHHKIQIPYFVDEKDGNFLMGKEIELGKGLSSYVLKTKQAQLLSTKDAVHLVEAGEIDEVLGSIDFSCWLGAPMMLNGEVYGIIVVQSYSQDVLFDEQELNLLTFVAGHIANAIALNKIAHERKLAQEELIQKEKMASLGGLVAGISHEVNTPLGICVTATSHMLEEYSIFKKRLAETNITQRDLESFLEDIHDAAMIISTNVSRASDLVRSFKQVAVDQSSNDVREFNLTQYIDGILLSLKPKLKNTTHKVTINCPKDIEVTTNAGAISQIISNLIINALIHGFEEKQTGNITLNVVPNDDTIEMTFSDDGKGLSQQNLDQLFEPFFTTRRGDGGSGLGTHLVYNLVTNALKGSIHAESEVGKGLTYFITFPKTYRSELLLFWI